MPRITLSINRGSATAKTLGDINLLSVGFGLFQAWLYLAVFGMASTFGQMDGLFFAGAPVLSNHVIMGAQFVFFLFSGACLISIGFTNQMFLRFYVSKEAQILATVLSATGTCLLFFGGMVGNGLVGGAIACVAAVVMGAGASLLFAMWGTAFARYEFPTIIGNTALAQALAILCFIVVANWIPYPLSGIISAVLPVLAALFLWKLTPVPYYKRQEVPIFGPVPNSIWRFLLRFGLPTCIFGIALGALRYGYVIDLFASSNLTVDLVVLIACVLGLVFFFVGIGSLRDGWHWDMLFRWSLPLMALAFLGVPLVGIANDMQFFAVLLVVLGFFVFTVVMWVFFSDLAQNFSLSPIFVFGVGQGLIEIGVFVGMLLLSLLDAAQVQFESVLSINGGYSTALTALVLIVFVIVGYSLMPRQHEIVAIVGPQKKHYREVDAEGVVVEDGAERKPEEALESPKDADASTENLNVKEAESTDSEAADTGEVEPEIGDESKDNKNSEDEDSDLEKIREPGVQKGHFVRRVEEIADVYLLSRREVEVLFLLAKGHNAAFIQDKLCISRSTAKTHINHIYRKMDIHTQQELLNMVEDRPRGPLGLRPNASGLGAQGIHDAQESRTARQEKNYRVDIFKN